MPVRRIIALFAVALVVAGLGYSAYWFHAAASLRKGVEEWAEARRAQGWQVSWRELTATGFPLHLRLEMAAPQVADTAGHSWRGDHLTAHAAPFDWRRLRMTTAGRHAVAWPGGEAALEMTSARADVNFDRKGGLDDATLLVSTLSVAMPGGEALTVAGLAVTWDPLPVAHADHSTPTIGFSATVHDVVLPPLPGLPLDRAVALAEVTGRVLGPVPDGSPAEALARWSADGGTVELDHIGLEWAPMAMEAQGTLALDPAGQPLASLTTRMRGFAPLMDRLAERGTLPADAASAAKMVLMLMAKPDAKGRPSVPVPVSVQDGSLYLGPARVAQVPALNWR